MAPLQGRRRAAQRRTPTEAREARTRERRVGRARLGALTRLARVGPSCSGLVPVVGGRIGSPSPDFVENVARLSGLDSVPVSVYDAELLNHGTGEGNHGEGSGGVVQGDVDVGQTGDREVRRREPETERLRYQLREASVYWLRQHRIALALRLTPRSSVKCCAAQSVGRGTSPGGVCEGETHTSTKEDDNVPESMLSKCTVAFTEGRIVRVFRVASLVSRGSLQVHGSHPCDRIQSEGRE